MLQRLRRGNGVLSLWDPPICQGMYTQQKVFCEGTLHDMMEAVPGIKDAQERFCHPEGSHGSGTAKLHVSWVFLLYSIYNILLVYVGVSRVGALASQ